MSGPGRWLALGVRLGLVFLLVLVALALGLRGGEAVPRALATSPQTASPTSPPARFGAGMAYDAGTGSVVLFGGQGSSTLLNDTWVWTGTSRLQVRSSGCTASCPNSPTARWEVSMAYDPAAGTVVLFGGCTDSSCSTKFNDTWEWNGSSWTQALSPGCSTACPSSPPAREAASMAADATTGTVVLFGGFPNTSGVLNDTWLWNGSSWNQANPAISPPARADAPAAFDAATGTVVLFGGCSPRVIPGRGLARVGASRTPPRPPAPSRRWLTTPVPAPSSSLGAIPSAPAY